MPPRPLVEEAARQGLAGGAGRTRGLHALVDARSARGVARARVRVQQRAVALRVGPQPGRRGVLLQLGRRGALVVTQAQLDIVHRHVWR